VKVIEAAAPLPVRRRVTLPAAKGVSRVVLELWEGRDEVRVDKAEKVPREKIDGEDDDDDDEYDEDEPEDVKTPVTVRETVLGALELAPKDGKGLVLEVIVHKGGALEARLWEEGREAEADKIEV